MGTDRDQLAPYYYASTWPAMQAKGTETKTQSKANNKSLKELVFILLNILTLVIIYFYFSPTRSGFSSVTVSSLVPHQPYKTRMSLKDWHDQWRIQGESLGVRTPLLDLTLV